jgi:hypothetical protein
MIRALIAFGLTLLTVLSDAQNKTNVWGINTSMAVKHDFGRFASSNFSPFALSKIRVIYENKLANRIGFGMQIAVGYAVDKTRFRLHSGSAFIIRQRMIESAIHVTVPLRNKNIKPYGGLSGNIILGTDYSVYEFHNGNDPNPTYVQFNIERAEDSIKSSLRNFAPGIIVGCSFRLTKTLFIDANIQHVPVQLYGATSNIPYYANSLLYQLPLNYRPTYFNIGLTWFLKKASTEPAPLSD